MVRLPLQQRLDAVVLPIREPELAVDRLFGDGAQEVILALPLDVAARRRHLRQRGYLRRPARRV